MEPLEWNENGKPGSAPIAFYWYRIHANIVNRNCTIVKNQIEHIVHVETTDKYQMYADCGTRCKPMLPFLLSKQNIQWCTHSGHKIHYNTVQTLCICTVTVHSVICLETFFLAIHVWLRLRLWIHLLRVWFFSSITFEIHRQITGPMSFKITLEWNISKTVGFKIWRSNFLLVRIFGVFWRKNSKKFHFLTLFR